MRRVRNLQVERLVGLGAAVRDRQSHWVVRDVTGGHVACVVPDQAGSTSRARRHP